MRHVDFDQFFTRRTTSAWPKRPSLGKKGVILALVITLVAYLVTQYVLMIPMTLEKSNFFNPTGSLYGSVCHSKCRLDSHFA